MPDGHPDGDDRQQQNARRALHRGFLWFVGYMLLLAVSMFLPAGRLGWTEGWAFLVTYLVLTIGAVAYLWRANPDVVIARSRFHWKGQPVAQMITFVLLFVLFLVMFPVAALDWRFHWSGVPVWLTVVGYLLFLIGMAGNVWALSANKFAEPSVRIQTERHQKVVDTGPYAIVRHPLYATSLFLCGGIPLALGSFWALVPAAIGVGVIVVRTALEDRMLQKELDGYTEYASRVRHRLVPGVW
jgi:protein-S-isoprenylcysteine O-methyltransferase Ste14